MKRCYHSHKGLELKDGKVIYGGSCSDPQVKANVYIGLDEHSHCMEIGQPWNGS
jgi:hypothetical protein